MSEATKDIQDTTDLDASVAALKADGGTPPSPAIPPSPPEPAPSADDPNSIENAIDFEALATQAVDEMVTAGPADSGADTSVITDAALEEAVAKLISTPQAAAVSPAPDSSTMAEEDLAKAVEKLIQEAAAVAPDAPEPSETPKKIEALDAQIAHLADDLIAGEFADEQNVIQGQVGEPPAQEAPPPPAAADHPAPTSEPQPVSPPAPTLKAPAKAPAAVAPPPPAPKPPTPHKAAEPAPKKTKRHGVKIIGRLAPPANKALGLICLPLRHKPKYTRDLIGWLAIWTLFMSICLWAYVLFFRSAKPPAPTTHVVATEPEHAEAKAGHGEKKDAKADKAKADKAKADKAKTDKTKKPPAKKDAAKSHGGGH